MIGETGSAPGTRSPRSFERASKHLLASLSSLLPGVRRQDEASPSGARLPGAEAEPRHGADVARGGLPEPERTLTARWLLDRARGCALLGLLELVAPVREHDGPTAVVAPLSARSGDPAGAMDLLTSPVPLVPWQSIPNDLFHPRAHRPHAASGISTGHMEWSGALFSRSVASLDFSALTSGPSTPALPVDAGPPAP